MAIYHESYEVMKNNFDSVLSRYQIGLRESLKCRGIIFGCVCLLYHKCHKINLNCDGSFIKDTIIKYIEN